MSPKRKWLLGGLAICAVILVVGGRLIWALYQVPEFYAKAAAALPTNPQQRKQAAKQLVQETTNLVNSIQHQPRWSAEFQQADVNSWLTEELTLEKYSELLPEDIRDPRVVIESSAIQVGFQMKYKAWTGIASVRVRPWVTKEHQLALEIEQIRAGLVPIPLQETLRQLSKRLEESGFEVVWRQGESGNDVAVIDLNRKDGKHLTLESLTLSEGTLRIIGRSAKPGQQLALSPRFQQTPLR